MIRRSIALSLAMCLSLAVSFAYGEPRGREGEKSRGGKPQGEHKPEGRQSNERQGQNPGGESRGTKPGGNQAPGGDWSQRTHGGKQSTGSSANRHESSGAAGAVAGHAAGKNNTPPASGAQGAAAGDAAANRKSPQASGAAGAAAGAAAANRNQPPVSGAAGAAAGAAAANRKQPAVSGAAGAAAGAAAAGRKSPQVSGAEGAAVGAAAANRNTPPVSGAAGAAAGYAAVRNSFDHPNIYGRQWYGDHPGVWVASGWVAGAAWVATPWSAIAGHCGYGNVTPISYNYGVNVIAQDGNVMVDGQNVGTTTEFSQQAAELAASGAAAETSDNDQWLPVGVFAMVRNAQQHPQLILQIAINQQGILRGNYTDELTEHTLPIKGAADRQTQRAAWIVGDNQQTVVEAGLSDLAEGEAPALIHKNGKTDHWILVRLDRPNQNGDEGSK